VGRAGLSWSALSALAAIAVVLGCTVPAAAAIVPAAAVVARPSAPAGTGPLGVIMGAGNAISCPTAATCLAVGEGTSGTGAWKSIAEARRAGQWKAVTVKSPGSTAKFGNLLGVSCQTTGYCLAVGLYGPDEWGPDLTPYAAAWTGSSLTPVARLPVPAALSTVEATAVSCVAAASRVVIGTGFDESAFTTPGGFLGYVTCIWTWNLAVGSVGAGVRTAAAALAFNGATWTATKVPGPAKGKLSVFNGVSCPKVGDCVAIGNVGAVTASSPLGQLAGYWNGKTWQLCAA
jgi:hypothetical protein